MLHIKYSITIVGEVVFQSPVNSHTGRISYSLRCLLRGYQELQRQVLL